jgi:tripartite ATP-independent transporter DctP family solute receptor
MSVVTILAIIMVISTPVFAKTVTLKCAHVCAADHPYEVGSLKLAEVVAEQTGGELVINTFSSGSLGGERDINEGILLGTIDMTVCSLGVTATFVPEVNVFNLPFIFKGPEHFQKVVNSQIGEKLLAAGEKHGFKMLAFCGPVFRHPMNNIRPISSPSDFKGIKMRLMEVPIHIATYKAMGAIPTPIPFAELYSALQLGTADGNENAMTTLYTKKVYEVQKYISVLPVFSNGAALFMGLKQWDSLSLEHQKAILDAVPAFKNALNQSYIELEGTNLQKMIDSGIKMIQPDVTPFQESVKSVYDDFIKGNPEASEIIEGAKAIE